MKTKLKSSVLMVRYDVDLLENSFLSCKRSDVLDGTCISIGTFWCAEEEAVQPGSQSWCARSATGTIKWII